MKSRRLWWCRIWVALLLSAGNLAVFAIDIWPIPLILAVFLMAACLCLRTEKCLKKYGNWIALWLSTPVLFYLNAWALIGVLNLWFNHLEPYVWGSLALLPLYSIYSLIVTTGSFLVFRDRRIRLLDGMFYTYYNVCLTKFTPKTAWIVAISLLTLSGLAFIGILALLSKIWILFYVFSDMIKGFVAGVFTVMWLIFIFVNFIYRQKYPANINQHGQYNKITYRVAAVMGPLITIILGILYAYIPV